MYEWTSNFFISAAMIVAFSAVNRSYSFVQHDNKNDIMMIDADEFL